MTVPVRERGAALVLVLVFTTAMAAAAVAFLAGRQTDALTLRGQLQSVEADAMLNAALQETVAVLANRTPRQVVPPQLQWTVDNVVITVRIEPESGKVDLNKAPDSLLRALPMALGADEKRAQAVAAAVQDWRDKDQKRRDGGAEDSDYRSGSSVARGSPDRPMANPAELLYLQGIDRSVWAALQPYVTVYSGSASPDAKEASPAVRKAMQIARGLARDEPKTDAGDQEEQSSDRTAGDSEAVAANRVGRSATDSSTGATAARSRFASTPGQDSSGSADRELGASTDSDTGGGGDEGTESATTVRLDVRFPNGYEAAAKAVIAMSGTGSEGPPYTVLSWTPVLRAQGEGS
jgi:general secretion pathway protein K